MIFTEDQLDEMENRALIVKGFLAPEDKSQIDNLWIERKRLINEVRRMYALMDQVARISYAAFHEV